MKNARGRGLLVGLLALLAVASTAEAQDDLFSDIDDDSTQGDIEGEAAEESPDAESTEEAPSEESAAEPDAAEATPDAPASADASVSAEASVGVGGLTDAVDADAEGAAPSLAAASSEHVTGSHIRRPRLLTDDQVLVIDSPLRTTVEGRDSVQLRRQLGGIAMPDTTAALGHGAPGTSPFALREQPTLILLNGRRLVSAPFWGRGGSDFVDLNQIPISLVGRVETTVGLAAGLYGDGALGGVVNYITHRDYEGLEVDLGGQVTDDLNQHEADVTLTIGAGDEKTGMNAMVSYFNRQPLAATDSDWIGGRLERHESILSNPASYQPLLNFVDYPFVDPGCAAATQVGDATGEELRVPLFGEPITRSGENALDHLPILPPDQSTPEPTDLGVRYREEFDRRGNSDGVLQRNETSTYCGADLTRFQDLILKEERIQTYTTFWHAFSDHTEAFGELGYYRNENENRTSPSFPAIRISPNETDVSPVLVPTDHADIPLEYFGYAQAEDAPAGRTANNFFLVGSPLATHAGANVNERRIDTFRGVLGLQGDLEHAGAGSVLETWDWEVAGVYSTSEAVSRVPDILLDKLADALNNCAKTTTDLDVSSPTLGMQIPSTIKDRQEAGCYNPFYSAVVNNVAVDPLNVSSASVENDRGFITSDSETSRTADGFGIQDGGYICDPADPSLPCPDVFDPDGDGIYELAGTPNTKQVVDGMTGEHITQERRSLATADLLLTGDLAEFAGGGLAFGLGGQFRRETLAIDYDAAFNRRLYAFVFGAPDVEPVGRNVGAGLGELRLRVADGLLEVQAAARAEHYENVGTAFSPQGGIAVRPFAGGGGPLEWLLIRGHAGIGHRAPTLLQQYGTYTQFHAVEFLAGDHFIPHQVQGNPDLDFEKYTTFSGGLQWDYLGIHLAGDFWMTFIDDVIGADNTQTLLTDCAVQFVAASVDCRETRFIAGGRTINHVESPFDNLAEVETNGLDGGISYTLDTKRRGLGEIGTFVVGAQGRFINSYLIKSPRALREYYRLGGGYPGLNADGTRDYSQLSAEYEAAGYRNLENFAAPMPKLRFAVPLRWIYEGHMIGATMRYIGSYFDDSENTIEKYGLTSVFAAPRAPGTVPVSDGEEIDAWMVFDLGYSVTFGNEGWKTKLALGVLNVLDQAPPAAESPLAYDVGVHDPRGRMIHARVTGEF